MTPAELQQGFDAIYEDLFMYVYLRAFQLLSEPVC